MRELHYGPGACLLGGCGYYMFNHGWAVRGSAAQLSTVRGDEQGFYWELRPDNQAVVVEAMRHDWERHRAQIMEAWAHRDADDLSVRNRHDDPAEPWALRQFSRS